MGTSSYSPPTRQQAVKSAVAVNAGSALFTVANGRIRVFGLIGYITTVIGGVATTLRIDSNPTTGADTALCAASASIAAAAAGSHLALTGLNTDAMQLLVATQGGISDALRPLIVAPGTIDLVLASGGTTGAITWILTWEPLDPGATVS